MTSKSSKEITCSVCSESSEHPISAEALKVVGEDLDGRPQGSYRRALQFSVQTCPSCGFSAQRLEERIKGAAEMIQTPRYRETFHQSKLPGLAKAYLRVSLLLENAGQVQRAGRMALRAAWASEDEEDSDSGARTMMMRAYRLLRRSGYQTPDREGGEYLLYADLLRRAGHFQQAMEECRNGLQQELHWVVREALHLEKALIQLQDTSVHSLEAVIDPGPEPEPTGSLRSKMEWSRWQKNRRAWEEARRILQQAAETGEHQQANK